MERYVIHACPDRMWYVDEYLVPSMLKQHIPRDEIIIWCDVERKGCLQTAIDCFEYCGKHEGGCWHLQDDVIIAKDFAKRTQTADSEIECGFCHSLYENSNGRSVDRTGKVESRYMWSSFPCIYIPNRMARDFVEWYYTKAMYRPQYEVFIFEKKHDDGFWRDFVNECLQDEMVLNHVPSLIDHVDWLIGGSVVNRLRGTNVRSYYWTDEDMIEDLRNRLRKEGHGSSVLF